MQSITFLLNKMKKLNRAIVTTNQIPVKILQFGEGNFLRAFVEWMIDGLNEKASYAAGVAVIQPIEHGMVKLLSEQDGLYHHLMQGIENGQTLDEIRLLTCIQQSIDPFKDQAAYYNLASSKDLKLIFSNTTEAGIAFDPNDRPEGKVLASTFPGKLVQFLFKRYSELGDSDDSEIGIIPCELLEANGDKLRKCVDQYIDLWGLDIAFSNWVNKSVHFANTLVDRIVPGYPGEEIDVIRERIGFDDQLVVKSESFHLFVIEGDEFIQTHFPAHKHGFNVKYVASIKPYRTQKVRILNGAHTSMVPVGLLSDITTVRESVKDNEVGKFIREAIFSEILETIDLPGEDPKVFANQVLARFENPFIRHELISISLNSVSKWRVRVLPTVLDFIELKGELPKRLLFSLSCLIQLHMSGQYELKDDEAVLTFFNKLKAKTDINEHELAYRVLSNTDFWGRDLTEISGLCDLITAYLKEINSSSTRHALNTILYEKSLTDTLK